MQYEGVIAAFADPSFRSTTVGAIRFTDTAAHLDGDIGAYDRAVDWASIAG